MVKLHIPNPDETDTIVGENVWATPLKHGNFRIENHPALTDEVCFQDIVKAEVIDDRLVFQRVVIRNLSSFEEHPQS